MIDKKEAVEELATLRDFFGTMEAKRALGSRLAGEHQTRIMLLLGYVETSRGLFQRKKNGRFITPRVTSTEKKAARVAKKSADAYSVNRYRSWRSCAQFLLEDGWDEKQTEAILRSKVMRWAADQSISEFADVRHLRSYVQNERNGVTPKFVNDLVQQTFMEMA